MLSRNEGFFSLGDSIKPKYKPLNVNSKLTRPS